jgi:hypothetical protein
MRKDHLDDRTLAQAAVDGESAFENRHLAECAACRDQVENLRADLARLGRHSREATPLSHKNFTWGRETRTASARGWGLLWSPAAGAMAAALILAVVWLGFRLDSPSPQPPKLSESMPFEEIMEAEPEALSGFAGFLVAENSSGLEQVFIGADDDDYESGAEGVILWPGVL